VIVDLIIGEIVSVIVNVAEGVVVILDVTADVIVIVACLLLQLQL